MALVAGVAGSKKDDGTRFSASDFFSSLGQPEPVHIDELRRARVARGLDPEADGSNVVAGWDRWALMCRQAEQRRSRGA